MIKMNEYANRRQKLIKQLEENSIVILSAAKEKTRNGDALFYFRQNSDFYYLTGFDEPEAIMVLIPGRKDGEYILFNRIRDRDREIWDGPRVGQEGAVKDYLADQAFPIEKFKTMLPELLAGRERIFFPLGQDTELDLLLVDIVNDMRTKLRGGIEPPTAFVDVGPLIHELRLFKSKAEIEVIQKAVEITGKGHLSAMKSCAPGKFEYEIEAAMLYEFNAAGARATAYTSIVGAGRNSCILHYVANNQKVSAGDLVLIDAGAEYQNYAADITRTFPANGKFTGEQRAIYELVLSAQLAAIDAAQPGASFMAAQSAIVEIITQGLKDLGLLKGDVDGLIEQQAYFPFYMHRSGHWLGLDVHDVGRYRVNDKWRNLEANMVLTIEPGIYISADIPRVHEKWHNIGVRIEDDVLITKDGNRVLSAMIPKDAAEIETIMRQ